MMEQGYSYQPDPRAVPTKPKYREPTSAGGLSATGGSNIMWDRRVHRGSNFAPQTLPASSQPDPVALQKEADLKRRRSAQSKQRALGAPRTPDAVDGRKHIDIQTEVFLEEISDRVPDIDAFSQTDPFADRPPSPVYIPAKSGVDATTQIYEGDLFDFNLEVEPILEVLVGKTLEQSMMEVLEEEELANMRMHQQKYEQLRNAELAETQRMEAAEKRRVDEKERRKAQERARVQKEQAARDKIAARSFAQAYLQDLQSAVFGNLHTAGFFYDRVQREMETQVIPWLFDGAVQEAQRQADAQQLVDHLIRSALERGVFNHRESIRLQHEVAATSL